MLSIFLYSQVHEIYNLSFIENKEFPVVFITPDSDSADIVRSKLQNTSKAHGLKNFDAITLSGFTQSELERNQSAAKFKKKSELELELSVIFRKYFPEETFGQFQLCFTLLTELRSYTLDQELLADILEDYGDQTKKQVLFLNAALAQLDLLDEHGKYILIADGYRTVDSPTYLDNKKTNIVVSGFNFLSAVQVDMIKALSIHHDVYMPFSNYVYTKSKTTDWIQWLNVEKVDIKVPEEIGHIEKSFKEITFARNRLSETLAEVKVQEYDHLIFGSKGLDFGQYIQVPDLRFYKGPINLLIDDVEQIYMELQRLIPCDLASIRLKLDDFKLNSLKLENFKQLKAVFIFYKVLDRWEELKKELQQVTPYIVDEFDLKIFKNVTVLDSPRNYVLTLSENRMNHVLNLSDLDEVENNQKVLVCLGSFLPPLKDLSNKLPESVIRKLIGIGPIPNNEIDFLSIKESIVKMLRENDVTFLIEKDFLEHDIGWSEILEDIRLESENVSPHLRIKSSVSDMLTCDLKLYSHTSLQTYYNCPRKFYHQFVEKIDARIEISTELSPSDLGQLEHLVIQQYFQKFELFSNEKLTHLITQILSEQLLKKAKRIDALTYDGIFQELFIFARNGLMFLYELKNQIGIIEYEFEKDVSFGDIKGRIDFLAKTNKGYVVLDFKRSDSSVPSKKEILSMDEFQLWMYIYLLKKREIDIVFAGFVCLKEPSKSRCFSYSNETIKILDTTFGPFEKNGDEHLQMFEERLGDIKNKLINDLCFNANPRHSSHCNFCVARVVCDRGISI